MCFYDGFETRTYMHTPTLLKEHRKSVHNTPCVSGRPFNSTQPSTNVFFFQPKASNPPKSNSKLIMIWFFEFAPLNTSTRKKRNPTPCACSCACGPRTALLLAFTISLRSSCLNGRRDRGIEALSDERSVRVHSPTLPMANLLLMLCKVG